MYGENFITRHCTVGQMLTVALAVVDKVDDYPWARVRASVLIALETFLARDNLLDGYTFE